MQIKLKIILEMLNNIYQNHYISNWNDSSKDCDIH